MTIQNETCSVQYQGDGSVKTFTVPFYFFDEELAVYLNDSDTALIKNTDYTISGGGISTGGDITFKYAPLDGDIITILRDVNLSQDVSFIEGEEFPASDYEYSLDKIIMCLQQLKETLSRTFATSPGSTQSSEDLYSIISFINENIDVLANLSSLSEQIEEMYQSLSNSSTDTVEENETKFITSGGVYSYLEGYDTSEEVDEKILSSATLKYDNISISIDDIESDNTYSDYPYKLDVEIDDALTTHCPFVILGVSEATSGIFAPVSTTGDGYVRLYLNEVPEDEFSDTITIVLN